MQVIRSKAITVRIPLPDGVDVTPLQRLVRSAGGCTIIPGLGRWYSKDGEVVKEGVYVYHMTIPMPRGTPCAEFTVRELKKIMQQMLDCNTNEQEFLVLVDTPDTSETITYRRD